MDAIIILVLSIFAVVLIKTLSVIDTLTFTVNEWMNEFRKVDNNIYSIKQAQLKLLNLYENGEQE